MKRVCFVVLCGLVKLITARLYPVGSGIEEDIPENTFMPNERTTLDDCHLRYYVYGGRGLVGPAFAQPAFLTEFAHIGAIGWTQQDGTIVWACGGSLIWNNYVITAAHCTANDENIPPDVVRFGDLNIYSADDDTYAQQITIVNIFRHPKYLFSSKYYDIALLQLEHNITVHETVAPACLWLDQEVRFKQLESAGWGQTGFGESKTPVLLKVTLKPISNENCSENYTPATIRGLRKGLDEHHICAGDEKMDTCLGDSGGPLHIRLQHNGKVTPFLVGLTSFGRPCGQSHPGVYTRIAPFRSWILETLQSNGAPEITDSQFEPADCALRYVAIRQLAISNVVTNGTGVYESFNPQRSYITTDFMKEIVELKWPDSIMPQKTTCMGAIIDHDTVVILGDCASHAGVKPSHVIHYARTGYSYDAVEEMKYTVTEVYVHPNYTKGSYYNNIAVLKINGSFNVLPACIWNAAELPHPEIEMSTVGRVDLNVYQYKDKTIHNSSSMRLTSTVYAYDNNNCSLPTQYLVKLEQGLLHQHLCFGNDPFLVPQVCELTSGGPLQRTVVRLQRFFTHVYGISLFGRDCGFGEPAVAVRLHAHMDWLESVLLPNRSLIDKTPTKDAVLFINSDLELFDRCDFYDGSVGLCVPVEHCRGVRNRVNRQEGLLFCTNGTVVCCLPKDVMDDEQRLHDEDQQIEDCENRYEPFRRRNFIGASQKTDVQPHIVDVVWMDERSGDSHMLCLGYLITTSTAITSAACTLIENRKPNFLTLGSIRSQYEDPSIRARIKSIISHPQYNSITETNNLALLKLFEAIQPTAAVFPGCLWRNETHTPLVSTIHSVVKSQLRRESVHPMYTSHCERIMKVKLHAGEYCTLVDKSISSDCPNSGDPIVWHGKGSDAAPVGYLVGIFSKTNCGTDDLFFNTRISVYVSWIIDNLR
ncbi:transmembrane protease serine 9-like [Anopheles funestus]|uniref:transmembrane protease serine 9-like n=1 Tax=Anopheles funestus TaxID=62324 RepID=UPI0020C6C572|nr:transmembrane protease serine 9-like [Anopheles funestus]